MIQDAIGDLATGASLGFERAYAAMAEIMDSQATPAQIGAFLMGLRMKGEGPDEIAGMATAMRDRSVRIRSREDERVVNLCGTGGARLTTFNVSTIAMFVVAAAGVRVAKHGNRAVTSRCGSADLLEALGARVDLEPSEVERILEAHGLCFMFAPKFHPAMQHAMGPRRGLGVRTVFNLLGPLTNPAGAQGQRGGRYLRFREGGFPPGSTPPCGGGPRLGEGVRNLAYLREGHRRKFVEGGGRWTPLSASW